jgi:5'-nucleotidase
MRSRCIQPLYVHEAANGFRYVNGTPADCVHIALTGLLGYRLFGVPAIAFSQTEKGWRHIEDAGRVVRDMVQRMTQQQLVGEKPWLLNVNIPNLPYDDLKPMKVCRLGRRHAAEKVITMTSPRGETMYWIGDAGAAMDDSEGTDFHAAKLGHVTMTPLKVDLTDHDHLRYWAQTASKLMGEATGAIVKPDDAAAGLPAEA